MRFPEPLQSRASAHPSHIPRLGMAGEQAGARACRELWPQSGGSSPSQAPHQAPHTLPSSGILPASSQGMSGLEGRWYRGVSGVSEKDPTANGLIK